MEGDRGGGRRGIGEEGRWRIINFSKIFFEEEGRGGEEGGWKIINLNF